MLTERQRRFVAAYRANGGAAAADGGGQAAAEAAVATEARRGPEVTQERIVAELARIAFADGETRDGDKLRALEMLTRLLPPDDGGDDGRGVVILPEAMASAGAQ